MASTRLDVPLDAERADRLAHLAATLHVEEAALASMLLSAALDDLEQEPTAIGELLDRVPGASERIIAGLADLEAGRTLPLDTL